MSTYPTIPQDTLLAASSLYGIGNIYLRLGDQLDELLVGLLPQDTKSCRIKNLTRETIFQYALLTIFQFVEELADQPLIEAVRNRVDLKYALHLAMNSPDFDSRALCEFRQHLFADLASQQILQIFLYRLSEFGLFNPARGQPVDALQLLITVCALNQFDEVLEAMYRVLESLAVTNPEWLRQITLPHWYDRYNRRRRLNLVPFSDEKWNTRYLHLAADIKYLLEEIDKSRNPGLASLQEIQQIRQVWTEQIIASAQESGQPQDMDWRLAKCATCSMHAGLKNA